jgi:hypothetical protein
LNDDLTLLLFDRWPSHKPDRLCESHNGRFR